MVIPWKLLLTAAAGIVLAAWWASRRARAAELSEETPADLATVLAVGALIGGRLVPLALDVAVAGLAALDPRAVLTLGAGISTPGALLGGIGAAWIVSRRRPIADGVWRAAVPPVAAGLAVWSALAFVRGAALGVAAPIGITVDGQTRIPVALLEALVYAAVAAAIVWAERRPESRLGRRLVTLATLEGRRLAAAFVAVVAGVHLLGGLARPAVATADGDLDVLLAVVALAVAVLLARGASVRVLRGTAVGGAALTLVVTAAALGGTTTGALRMDPAVAHVDFDGAIVPGQPGQTGGDDDGEAEARALPRWTEADLAAYVAAADGKPVVVNFWASWCPPCRAEAPMLARSARALDGRVVFLGVNVDADPAAARAFSERHGLPFPSVGERGLRGPLGMAGLPTTVVLDGEGRIVARVVGGLDARSLAAAIDRAR